VKAVEKTWTHKYLNVKIVTILFAICVLIFVRIVEAIIVIVATMIIRKDVNK
jgi:hypothetical protein